MKGMRTYPGTAMLTGLLALTVSACDNREVAEPGSGTVARYGRNVKPEGVSTPHDAVTTTYYVPSAVSGHLYEISAGKLALARSDDADVARFAARMIADHQKMLDTLKRFVADNPINIAVPEIMDSRHKAMIENLESASDAEFDRIYVGQQAAAHQKAYYLHQSFASSGKYPALTDLAEKSAAMIEQHREALAPLEKRLVSR